MKTGPIVIIEDDADDQFILQEVIRELKVTNPIRFFSNGLEVLDYLLVTTEQPFFILCDVNMHLMNGLELRQHIEDDELLKRKAIPFIFLTTDASPELVTKAYNSTIQGFFKKASNYEDTRQQLYWIVGYWINCLHPKNLVDH